MTTKRTKSCVYEHFALTMDKKHFVCQSKEEDGTPCGAKISANFGTTDRAAPTRVSNLKRHLERFHAKVFAAVVEADSKETETSKSMHQEQARFQKFFTQNKVTLNMTCAVFKKCLIDLVVKNGVAMSLFSQPAFCTLVGEMAKKFGVSLERTNIRKLIIDEASKNKGALRKNLEGKYIYLKMDAATRHRVNYFAINVRFVGDDGKIVTKTLAVRDTRAHHDSSYLHRLIEDILAEFEIKKGQILCIVSDNASNMVKTVEKLNETGFGNDSASDGETNTQGDSEEFLEEDDTLDDITEEASLLCKISHMRCAVHTLQLAIRDGIKHSQAASLVTKIRKVATAARTLKIDSILKRRANKGALIDQATRWGSTYLMINRLLDLKSFLEDIDNPSLSLTANEWDAVRDVDSTLRLAYLTTKRLQEEDSTGGKFF